MTGLKGRGTPDSTAWPELRKARAVLSLLSNIRSELMRLSRLYSGMTCSGNVPSSPANISAVFSRVVIAIGGGGVCCNYRLR